MKNKSLIKIAVAGIIIFLAIRYFKGKNKKPKFDKMNNRTDWTTADIQQALSKVKAKYGQEYATNVEKLFRIETAHFTSGQWKKTLSPGMEIAGGTTSTKNTFPFGWSSLQKFISANPSYNKDNFYVARMTENGTGIGKTFVGFPNVECSFMFVAWFIKNIRGGRFGYWKSLNESSALSYENSLSKIKTQYA